MSGIMEGATRLRADGAPDRRLIGRYVLFGEIASGGMASVHYARLNGPAGFARTVAIKRMHPHFAKDPEFVAMFLDEARLAARIRHPNVVPTLDVVTTEGEIFLVMEYVQGESLGRLVRALRGATRPTDTRIMSTIMSNVLLGLHAAHEAKNEQGEALGIVHRDVSPQNVIVGVDGVARVLDFGVAKAVGRLQSTQDGQVKGKLAYMAPEQLHGSPVTRQSDVYAAAVVTWEALTGQRLFNGESEAAMIMAVLQGPVRPPSSVAPHVPDFVDDVVMRGLSRSPERRYATAREMALELEKAAGVASPSEIGDWVEALAHEALIKRASRVAEIESVTSGDPSRFSTRSDSDLPTTLTATDASPDGSHDVALDGARSGVSSIVAPTPTSHPRQMGKVAFLVGLAAVALLSALALGLVLGQAHGTAAGGASDDTKAMAPAAAGVALSPSAGSAVAPLPAVAMPADQTEPVAAASSSPPAPTHQPMVHIPAHVAGTRTNTPVTQSAALQPTGPDCNPPYWYDGQGHKRWKEACLK